ncbi:MULTISPECIES: hypothetical protein [Acetobacter]|uniref:Uncharacterized protein n=2 Tax=Acetobacter TaxID=434 RepID=A0AAN1PHG0_9PROT|nr:MULTISPECIES: hypothetical protein [Acetobacter]ASL40417.1 hypothetical protein CBI36_08215 [Acetobacter oryzifermentans]AXN00241.1 hypothetical protein CJF59_06575 [Acetobacter pomorum]KAA8395487.1 hypothetical protein FKW19_10205 [Acetobacter sp. DmW_125128]KAA8396409.1 hypothetical protein FKW20_10970 [Acetobacter sp. DmW_125127]KAA8397397.1 hypothetical protein FKW22_04640 [Acetobacter sp. DmW_125124]
MHDSIKNYHANNFIVQWYSIQHAHTVGNMRKLLLTGSVFTCTILLSAPALADDAQELAAIKAEMRRLAAQVEAIESRQAKRHTGTSAPARNVAHSANTPASAHTGNKLATAYANQADREDPSIRFSPDEAPVKTASNTQGGTAKNGVNFKWLPGATGSDLPSGADAEEKSHSSIDLSSSSPTAITQTEVDRLPPIFSIGGISVKLGGFIDMSNIWRSSNMTSGPATGWGNFPYANSPNHGLSEERLSAQLSRLSILMEANPSKSSRLQAYVESDFAGSGSTTNSVQINGYTPRLRQGYFTFTQKDWGLHILMGQAWSLATNYAKGIIPRQEELPAVTDNNQLPGIVFTRVPQIRIGKDWNQKYWLGLSIEDPQATVGFSSTVSSGSTIPAARGQAEGARVYYANTGGMLLNAATNYSYNPVPDMILKAAADTSFGHYEVFGLARWFRSLAVEPGTTTTKKHTHFGGGVGAGMTAPLGTNRLHLTGDVLAGDGIGRYGPTQIPDTTFNGRGQLTPVPEIMGSLGLVGHPNSSVLLYTYGGVEASGRKRYIGADGKQYGYGVNDLDLAGCDVEFGVCSAQTHTLASFTAGGWWHFLQGRYGSMMAGLQYTFVRKFAFKGNDGHGDSVDPATSGNTVYVTFRYFPFQ